MIKSDTGKLDDFTRWDPNLYLKEYFPPKVTGEPAVKFVVEEGRRIANQPVVIDVGCGPTVCYWSAVAPYVSGILLADYLEINLRHLEHWVNNDSKMFDWRDYTRFILEYEGKELITDYEIQERENLSRSKVIDYLWCDITKKHPLGSKYYRSFDCVISLFCADGITDDKSKWWSYMKNIFTLLKPGGFFIGGSMRNCPYYSLGNMIFPSANVSETDFLDLLLHSGFDQSTIRVEIEKESAEISDMHFSVEQLKQEYDEVVLVSGFLRLDIDSGERA